MRVIRIFRSESGISMVATIFPLAIILIAGLAIMSRVIDDSSGISEIRKSTQGSVHAENGVEWGINQLSIPVSKGGKGRSWTTASASTTINAALLNTAQHVTVDVKGADGARTGIARVVVQPVSGEADQRIITAMGQQCLNDDCTKLGPERLVRSVVRTTVAESVGTKGAFEHLTYAGDTGASTAIWFREAWIQGDSYWEENVTLEWDHPTNYIGKIFAHENILNDCLGLWGGATIYSFGIVNKNPIDDPGAGCPTTYENYNGDVHNNIFKDITLDVALDRQWYRNYSDKYFPADAATNNGASQSIWFCADAAGAIRYKVGTGGTACDTLGTPLLNDAGGPFTEGIVFVAGDIKVEDMMAGSVTFVAAGPNTGSSFGILSIVDHLYSKNTPNGLGTPSCSKQRAGVAGATDSIGLVADIVKFGKETTCLTVRAVIHAKTKIASVSGTTPVLRETDEPFYFRGSIVIDDPSSMDFRGESTMPWSMRILFDPDAVGDNLPAGVIGGDSGSGSSSISIERLSYSEVTSR